VAASWFVEGALIECAGSAVGRGVMAARQVLALLVEVRVLAPQLHLRSRDG
jgi:hypothetical protein